MRTTQQEFLGSQRKNSGLRRGVGAWFCGLGVAFFVWRATVFSALTDLALSFVLEFFFFFLLFRQFFLTFLVSVIRCCQSMLSSYWGALYHFHGSCPRWVRNFCQCSISPKTPATLAADPPASRQPLPDRPKSAPKYLVSGAQARHCAWRPSHTAPPDSWGRPSCNLF